MFIQAKAGFGHNLLRWVQYEDADNYLVIANSWLSWFSIISPRLVVDFDVDQQRIDGRLFQAISYDVCLFIEMEDKPQS